MIGVFETTFDALSQGGLACEFLAGASAAVISAKSVVQQAWNMLIRNSGERLPWETSLLDISRNHQTGDGIAEIVGDAYYFKPGRHAHFARKLELSRASESASVECRPAHFVQGRDIIEIDRATRDLCWDVGTRIMQSLTPVGETPPSFVVAVQRLKYLQTHDELESVYRLINDSLGGWGQIGYAMDSRRDAAQGLLSPRGVCDLYALFGTLTPLRNALDGLNRLCSRTEPDRRDGKAETVMGKAHFDGRYFSGLTGLRNAVATEIFVDGRWSELPIGLDSIVVIPGRSLYDRFKIKPTLHRVLQRDAALPCADDERGLNVTLLIGAK